MKKVLLTVAAVMAFGLMNAQEVKYGAKAGLNMLLASSEPVAPPAPTIV